MAHTHTSRSPKADLIQRLRYLWTWELFDSVFLPAVMVFAAYTQDVRISFFAAYAIAVTTLILWQGAAYWWLKLRSIRKSIPLTDNLLRAYAVFKRINWMLLVLVPVVGLLYPGRPGKPRTFNLLAGTFFALTALLEQVNYYYVQLMYDTKADWRYLMRHKRLKRASLAQDLSQWKRTRR